MHAIKLFFSGLILSVSSLLPQPHADVSKPVIPPHASPVARPSSSSTTIGFYFHASTTVDHATGTEGGGSVKQNMLPKTSVSSSQVKSTAVKPSQTVQPAQKKTLPLSSSTSSPKVQPAQTASSSVSQTLPVQGSGGASQSSLPLTDDPNQPLPDTGNPCDILDEGAVCTLNGVHGTCQIQGEAITCTP